MSFCVFLLFFVILNLNLLYLTATGIKAPFPKMNLFSRQNISCERLYVVKFLPGLFKVTLKLSVLCTCEHTYTLHVFHSSYHSYVYCIIAFADKGSCLVITR